MENKNIPTTWADAIAEGYIIVRYAYHRGYISRKCDQFAARVGVAGGNCKGQLYINLPCYNTTQYYHRAYIAKVGG